MSLYLTLFFGTLLALMLAGWLSDVRSALSDTSLTPGLELMPGDFTYESPSGNVKVNFAIVASIVASIVLGLALNLFR